MNIFVTDEHAQTAVKHLDNRRLVKMVLETCQLLSTAMWLNGQSGPYKATHKNHPCTKWTAFGAGNFSWLLLYFHFSLEEYTRRFNKTHKCESHFDTFVQFLSVFDKNPDKTEFVNCTPFKDEKNVFVAYKKCLIQKWENDKVIPKWSGRDVPDFYQKGHS